MIELFLLCCAALLGGAMNAVAGGGTFFAFPALLFSGASAISANVTCTIALWPGAVMSAWAYRRELASPPWLIIGMGAIGVTGGLIGAVILLHTPEHRFNMLIPWLLLVATLLFAYGKRIAQAVAQYRTPRRQRLFIIVAIAFQCIIALYGGFFGAGIGILTLAMLYCISPAGMSIHQLNALKTILASCINAAAFAIFITSDAVLWREGVMMAIASIIGGIGGAKLSLRYSQHTIRRFILLVACLLTCWFFIKTYVA